MKRVNRFGLGQAGGRGGGIRRGLPGPKLSERDREVCARCTQPRWIHERRNGFVPDHKFEEPCG